jgi:4-diphosphocytidyl-2-C-methyl-D-erythritol kinase
MLTVLAPAKINRELRIGAVRSDGFHEIRSRFASIDLADRLTAEPSGAGMAFSCDDTSVPSDERNLAVRAALLFSSRLGRAPSVRLRLEKRVPSGAGLGGGSADAAATLRLLVSLWRAEIAPGDFAELAARLGSDVPFFLTGGEADVAGRGELITPREDRPSGELLIFAPPFAIATAEVYAMHRRRHGGRGGLPERLEIETSGRFFGPNDLEPAILEVRPEMARLLAGARSVSAEAGITGSGSAIMLYEPAEDAAQRLAGLIPGSRFYRTRSLGRAEYRRRTSPA